MLKGRQAQIEEILNGLHALRCRIADCGRQASDAKSVSNSQWLALDVIGRKGDGVTVKDIAIALKISSSAATQLVDELARHHLVERTEDAADRRAVRIRLSPIASRNLSSMRQHIIKKLSSVFSVFSDKEFASYAKLNRKLLESSDRGTV